MGHKLWIIERVDSDPDGYPVTYYARSTEDGARETAKNFTKVDETWGDTCTYTIYEYERVEKDGS